MNQGELKQIIFRRQLQIMLIVGVAVFLLGGILYSSLGIVANTCDEGCPPQYVNFIRLIGLPGTDEMVTTVLYSVINYAALFVLAVGLVAYLYITTRLKREITTFIETSVQQREAERDAMLKIRLHEQVMEDDGEIHMEDRWEPVRPIYTQEILEEILRVYRWRLVLVVHAVGTLNGFFYSILWELANSYPVLRGVGVFGMVVSMGLGILLMLNYAAFQNFRAAHEQRLNHLTEQLNPPLQDRVDLDTLLDNQTNAYKSRTQQA